MYFRSEKEFLQKEGDKMFGEKQAIHSKTKAEKLISTHCPLSHYIFGLKSISKDWLKHLKKIINNYFQKEVLSRGRIL